MNWQKKLFLSCRKPSRYNNSLHPTVPSLRCGAAGEAERSAAGIIGIRPKPSLGGTHGRRTDLWHRAR